MDSIESEKQNWFSDSSDFIKNLMKENFDDNFKINGHDSRWKYLNDSK